LDEILLAVYVVLAYAYLGFQHIFTTW